MNLNMFKRAACGTLVSSVAALLCACGGGSGSAGGGIATPSGYVPLSVSDASSEDWATIGVRILSIAFVPQGGGTPVTVYTAPAGGTPVNLEQLDQVSELLGNVSVPAGTYTGAILTVSANPGDVTLIVSADPESGFAAAPGSTIPANQIQVQDTQGSTGSKTVPIQVSFETPLTVASGQSTTGVDLEFDLKHPAFILAHTPPGGPTLWAVDFDGPVRHHRIDHLTHLVLRHLYGEVSAVTASTLTLTRVFPTVPVVSPETAVTTTQSLQVQVDATNGTLFYDLDAKSRSVITDFTTANLSGRYVRIAARYQQDGSLYAVRVWASSQFSSVWVSPEGHVLHVDPATDVLTVLNESGQPVPVTVNDQTEFFFRAPADAHADATPIGQGTTFIAAHNLVRGFKVHVTPVDALATPLVAQSIDIETAAYSGRISNASASGFTYTHHFRTMTDDYSVALGYIAPSTANGIDGQGNPVSGYKFWDFAYPTLVTTGASAVGDFVAAVGGSGSGFSFAGVQLNAWGASRALWGDPAKPAGWSVPWTVLLPTPLPLGVVSTGVANDAFTLTLAGGSTPGTVTLGTTAGSATLAYQVDRSNGVVTVSPVDLGTSAGLATFTQQLAAGTPVKVFGVPQADGTLRAYVLVYFTGTQMPTG